ncbi:type II and III secretion system protein family protein, partial [Klebsiella pneumoniae]|nr:type II and III secretion system protein family protein [Klebsiella pneumoniae]
LNILQADGYAKVLAEPSLIAQSGQDASFLAGGEIPIPVPSGNGTIGIEYKKFGVGLSFTPTILSNKTIALRVSPEVSDLDFSRGTSIQGVLV